MTARAWSRRGAIRLLAGLSGAAVPGRAGLAQVVEDRGIGGTGVLPDDPPSDRGIGGTGVVGTIRRFGSVIVNDLRIAYGRDTAVSLDGEPASLAALRLGQVVRTLALPDGAGLRTRHIAIVHEVVGRVEAVSDAALTVLGQTVDLGQLARPPRVRRGDRVAVSGLRTPDDVIVATDMVPAPGRRSRVAGRLDRSEDGRLGIGGLALAGAEARLAGERVVAVGVEAHGRFLLGTLAPETPAPQQAHPLRLSVETLAVLAGGLARLDGEIHAPSGPVPVPDGLYRAIVTSLRQEDGRYLAESIRIADRIGSNGHGGNAAGSPPSGAAPAGHPRGGPPWGGAGGGSPVGRGPPGGGPDGRGFGGGSGGGGFGGRAPGGGPPGTR